MRRLARAAVVSACWVLAGAAVLTLAARAMSWTAWWVDMVATFAAQEAIGALVVGIAAAAVRVRRAGVVLVAVALVHGAWLAMGRAPRSAGEAEGPVVKVLTFNYRGANAETEPFIKYLLGSDADVVVVMETPQKLWQRIVVSEELRDRFPYRSLPRRGFWFNKIKLSRWPLEDLDLVDRSRPRERFNFILRGSALVHHPERPFMLAAMLPVSPRTPADWAEGNAEIVRSGGYVRDRVMPLGYPVMMCVDLNATPSGHRTVLARRVTGLRRSKPLGVIGGSWPSDFPWWARVAIDDVLVSRGSGVRSWRTVEGIAFGSDHVPVEVELELPVGSFEVQEGTPEEPGG